VGYNLRNRDKAKEHCVAEETILRPVEFLVVEDSPTDALLMQEALSHAKLWNNVHVVEDGEEALAFLRREGLYAHAPRPDLILLDLNLPRKDGREVLAEIKGEPTLKSIPVVVLTTSKDEQDVLQAYALHASCYITKPMDFLHFTEIMRSIEHFWFAVVTLPRR
jgi:chemotaxis family two-component system response regulator Rcp1